MWRKKERIKDREERKGGRGLGRGGDGKTDSELKENAVKREEQGVWRKTGTKKENRGMVECENKKRRVHQQEKRK